jgi:hypothetical protein
MRQLGDPPNIDVRMADIVTDRLQHRGYETIDADGSTGNKDYLERILNLIRGTGFTLAVFSHDTRPSAMANIALELGYAGMCGKPILIAKSSDARPPSDLKRTDWMSFDPRDEAPFLRKLDQAVDRLEEMVTFQETTLRVALDARNIDCGIAFERAIKGFLLSGNEFFLDATEAILTRLDPIRDDIAIGDLERLRGEIRTFLSLAGR